MVDSKYFSVTAATILKSLLLRTVEMGINLGRVEQKLTERNFSATEYSHSMLLF